MALTELQVRQAKPEKKNFKLHDKEGLYILVTPKGQKYWRAKYRFAKNEKTLSLGVYPRVSLTDARKKLRTKKQILENGKDPTELKRQEKINQQSEHLNTFESIARAWHNRPNKLAQVTLDKRIWILEKKLFPLIGKRPIAQITPPEILRAFRTLESEGIIETMHKAKQLAGQVFRYAVGIGKADSDPTRDLRDQLIARKVEHHPAITDPKEFGKLLVDMDNFNGTPVVKGLLNVSALLFQRPCELRKMEWENLDFELCEWRYLVTKKNIQHIVPLSRQALTIIENLRPLTGKDKYVFPCVGKRNKPASESAVTSALRRMGYSGDVMTAHGFRASARTMLEEQLGFEEKLTAQQISHTIRNPLGRAYDRTAHLPQRKQMMQKWADYLDALKAEAINGNVVAGKFNQGRS